MSRKPRIADDVLDAVREDDIASIIGEMREREQVTDTEDWLALA